MSKQELTWETDPVMVELKPSDVLITFGFIAFFLIIDVLIIYGLKCFFGI